MPYRQNEVMAKHIRKNQWNDRELHQLFAERLPVLEMPDDFLERLTESVLTEVGRHVAERNAHCGTAGAPTDVQENREASPKVADRVPPITTERLRRCRAPRRRVPPI